MVPLGLRIVPRAGPTRHAPLLRQRLPELERNTLGGRSHIGRIPFVPQEPLDDTASVRCLTSRMQPKYFSLNSSMYLSLFIRRCLPLGEDFESFDTPPNVVF